MGLSCIWWSMTAASCSRSASPPATSTTAGPFLAWFVGFSASCLATKAISPNPWPSSSLWSTEYASSPALRKNMRQQLLDLGDKVLLRKRALIETINDQLKNVCETLAYTPSQSLQLCRASVGGPHRLWSPTQETLTGSEPADPCWMSLILNSRYLYCCIME